MANDMAEMYDETELDQEGTVSDSSDKAEKDSGYESFLAPKSAFPESAREVGAVHKVKTMRSLDSELELQCVHGDKESDSEPEMTEETNDDLY